MSQLSLSLDTPLMVRDGRGRYRPADADQILEAARQVIEQKMQRGETFTSPEAVKDYLRAKLAGYEHEVFAHLPKTGVRGGAREAVLLFPSSYHGVLAFKGCACLHACVLAAVVDP